jgi:hypothetical protein
LPFDLRADRGCLDQAENREMIWNLFPETVGIGADDWFLQLNLKTMPPKPWPKTVGGLPVYFAPESGPSRQHSPMPNGRLVGRKNGSIAKDVNGQGMKDWKPIFILIKNHFQDMGIAITEVMNFGNVFMIVLEHRDVDFTNLPWKAANMGCLYLFDDEMGRLAAPQARRLADPTPGNPDHSSYDTLQPGVRVASVHLPSDAGKFMSTSAGVLVRDQAGNEFMTVASHGFPAKCDTQVMHPLPSLGRNIGELIMEVSHTDVALVKLRDTESFDNVTFCNDEMPEPIQLQRFVRAKDLGRFTPIAIDSPDTGHVDGRLMITSFTRVPTDDEREPKQDWILTEWYYMGQGSAGTLPEGICGSAVWTENGEVLGFFRYAPKEGEMEDWCAGIAADELINRGFSLVDTTRRHNSETVMAE